MKLAAGRQVTVRTPKASPLSAPPDASVVDDSADAPLRITAAVAAVLPAQPSLLVVSWTQDAAAEVHVAYSFDADVWMESPPRSLAAGTHEELLVGIPYGMSTTWRLVDAEGAALSVDTSTANGDPPEGLPLPEVLIEDPSRWDGVAAPYLFTTLATEGFGDPWWRVVYDIPPDRHEDADRDERARCSLLKLCRHGRGRLGVSRDRDGVGRPWRGSRRELGPLGGRDRAGPGRAEGRAGNLVHQIGEQVISRASPEEKEKPHRGHSSSNQNSMARPSSQVPSWLSPSQVY